eukprot:g26659.t1
MDPQLTWIQPGGGVIVHLELLWGKWRRFWLKTFRKGYVARMAELRQGDENRCPHEVLDPRDLKYHCNQGGWYWKPEDDPFTRRDKIPFARFGLAELLVFSLITFGPAALIAGLAVSLSWTGIVAVIAWLAVATFAVIGILIVWFFRDPPRKVPEGDHLVISPADGKVVAIDRIEHDEFIGGPAVQIGIFLSIFNVHINRMPIAGRVIGLTYKPGKYLNALRPESARENEQLAIRVEGTQAPHRRMIARQITGAIARRIVCKLKPGDELASGEQFGMIKLGSRTELVIPDEDGLNIRTKIGDKVSDVPATKNRRQKVFAMLPTLLTLGNATCGFGAITFAARVGPMAAYGDELWAAGALIYVAMIFDMFDGSAARLMNQTSEFGALLDSLCDVVSFGVAPAFLMIQFTRWKHLDEAALSLPEYFAFPPKLLFAIGALFMLCAILRLARFTVETDEDDSHEFFSGLPSPAAAGVVASFPIVMSGIRQLAISPDATGQQLAAALIPVAKVVLPLATIIAACLMISKIRYPHFFNQLFSRRATRNHVIMMLVSVMALAFMHQAILFIAFVYFAFGAPLRTLWTDRILPRFKRKSA